MNIDIGKPRQQSKHIFFNKAKKAEYCKKQHSKSPQRELHYKIDLPENKNYQSSIESF